VKLRFGVISGDSHVNEPPDLWTSRLPAGLRERAPHVIETRSGASAWVVEDTERPMPMGLNSVHYWWQKGKYDRSNYRDKYAEIRIRGVKYDDILSGSWDPKARLVELDEDHVDAEVLYNGAGIWPAIKNIHDRELNLSCFRAYNDWISEFESEDPERLVGNAACRSPASTTPSTSCTGPATAWACAPARWRATRAVATPSPAPTTTASGPRWWSGR